MPGFQPLNTSNNMGTSFNQLNDVLRQLNNEQTVKTFKQPNGNAIVTGKLPYDGGYGTLYYDKNGIPSIVIGIMPDGTTDFVISKPGVDVLTLFT
jgi:hypothetical protein